MRFDNFCAISLCCKSLNSSRNHKWNAFSQNFSEIHPLAPFRPGCKSRFFRNGGSRTGGGWMGHKIQKGGFKQSCAGPRYKGRMGGLAPTIPPRPNLHANSIGWGSCSFGNRDFAALATFSWPRAFPPSGAPLGDPRMEPASGTISHAVDLPLACASGPEAHDAARRWLAGGVLRPCSGTRAAPAPVPDHSPPSLHPAPTTSRGSGAVPDSGAEGQHRLGGRLAHRRRSPPARRHQPMGLATCPVTAFGRSPAHCGIGLVEARCG
jgi:hypothetical protein